MHCSSPKQAHSNLPPVSLKRAPIPLCVETKKRKNRLDIPFVRGDCLGRYLFRDFSRSRTRVHSLRPFGCLQVQSLATVQSSQPTKTFPTILKGHKYKQNKFVIFKKIFPSLDSETKGKGDKHCECISFKHSLGSEFL